MLCLNKIVLSWCAPHKEFCGVPSSACPHHELVGQHAHSSKLVTQESNTGWRQVPPKALDTWALKNADPTILWWLRMGCDHEHWPSKPNDVVQMFSLERRARPKAWASVLNQSSRISTKVITEKCSHQRAQLVWSHAAIPRVGNQEHESIVPP